MELLKVQFYTKRMENILILHQMTFDLEACCIGVFIVKTYTPNDKPEVNMGG